MSVAKAGIGFTPLDNAFAAVEDLAALQAICAELDAGRIDALLRKWLARLPHPFSASDGVGVAARGVLPRRTAAETSAAHWHTLRSRSSSRIRT